MKRLLLVLMFVPTTLLAQYGRGRGPYAEDTAGPPPRRAYALGVVAYTGGLWQPSGIEFAALWKLGPTTLGPAISLGSFTQAQAIYFGRSQGFFVTLGLTVRQPIVTLVEMGSERNPAYVRFEAALEGAGSRDFNSPLPQGPWSVRTAALLGISFGSASPLGQSFAVLYGPSALIGRETTTHGEFVLRFRMPVR